MQEKITNTPKTIIIHEGIEKLQLSEICKISHGSFSLLDLMTSFLILNSSFPIPNNVIFLLFFFNNQ